MTRRRAGRPRGRSLWWSRPGTWRTSRARGGGARAEGTLPLGPPLEAFAAARAANLGLLRSLDEAEWAREGQQDGVGPVRLLDLPRMMAEHDAGHREEVLALVAWLAAPSP